jgi:hypothetical protein
MKLSSPFEQKITNEVTYKGNDKDYEQDDYTKIYCKRRYFFGICIYKHYFKEDIITNDKEENNKPGFKIEQNGND